MKKHEEYSGSLTREQFLFYETRETARLLDKGLSDSDVILKIVSENLFQYPTERMLKNLATVCVKRLHSLDDNGLVHTIASGSVFDAKQICVYAMMRQYRIVWEFMVSVIAEKYRQQDLNLSRTDVTVFLMRLQEQNDVVASWAPSTIKKIETVLMRMLIEAEFIDSTTSTRLNPVTLIPQLENTIRANGDDIALHAFNCF